MTGHGPQAPGGIVAYVFVDDQARVEAGRYHVDEADYVTLRFATPAGVVFLCGPDRTTLRRLLVDAVHELAR